MNDLETKKLCAQALGYVPRVSRTADEFDVVMVTDPVTKLVVLFDPLKDRAQAMELVERFHMICGWRLENEWMAGHPRDRKWDCYSQDLLRAICTCVARMELAKQKAAA